jgi:hypothetical protein
MIRKHYGVHSAGGVAFLHQAKGTIVQTAVPLPGVESPFVIQTHGRCPHNIDLQLTADLPPELDDPLAQFCRPLPTPRRCYIIHKPGLAMTLEHLLKMGSPKEGTARQVEVARQRDIYRSNILPVVLWNVMPRNMRCCTSLLERTEGGPRPVLVVVSEDLPIPLPRIETELRAEQIEQHDWRAIGARVLREAMLKGEL